MARAGVAQSGMTPGGWSPRADEAAVVGGDPYMTLDFQDAAPFLATWTQGGGGSRDADEFAGAAACAATVRWGYSRVAAAPANGGYNDRGYLLQRFCSWPVSGDDASVSTGFSLSGYRFNPSGTAAVGSASWPTTMYIGFRVYFELGILPDVGGDTHSQFKFFIWHRDVYDGDQRIIVFLESGANAPGGADATHVSIKAMRSVGIGNDTRVAIPVTTWTDVVVGWHHGVEGVSWMRIWTGASMTEGAPAGEETLINDTPTNPGGTTEWVMDHAGYDAPMSVGDMSNTGTRVTTEFVFRLMDFMIGPTWGSVRPA